MGGGGTGHCILVTRLMRPDASIAATRLDGHRAVGFARGCINSDRPCRTSIQQLRCAADPYAQLNDFMVAVQYARSEAGRRGMAVSVRAENPGANANEWAGLLRRGRHAGELSEGCDGTAHVCGVEQQHARRTRHPGHHRDTDVQPARTARRRSRLTRFCQAGHTTGRTISISTIGRVSARTKTDCP